MASQKKDEEVILASKMKISVKPDHSFGDFTHNLVKAKVMFSLSSVRHHITTPTQVEIIALGTSKILFLVR